MTDWVVPKARVQERVRTDWVRVRRRGKEGKRKVGTGGVTTSRSDRSGGHDGRRRTYIRNDGPFGTKDLINLRLSTKQEKTIVNYCVSVPLFRDTKKRLGEHT